MTDSPSAAKRAAQTALAPVFSRIDAVRQELIDARERNDHLAAQVEQLSRQVERLEAYQHVTRERFERDLRDMLQQVKVEGDVGEDVTPPVALRLAFENVKLHAEVLAAAAGREVASEMAELRSNARLSQAMAERALRTAHSPRGDAAPGGAAPAVATDPAAPDPTRWDHPTPSFDTLYRAFEDHNRGTVDEIRERQEADYIGALTSLEVDAELPVVDLGCGRGELVDLLHEHGVPAIGVDTNAGQLVGADPDRFVEVDLFDWLDARQDASCRAVVSLHVVEHLPLDLQVRLVFEAHRVLAPGGLLVLETPNARSLSTAATNFWVDPTHHRPVHPLLLEFLAREAGFSDIRLVGLHPLEIGFRGRDGAPDLVDDLDSLVFGDGDLALISHR